MKHFIDKKLFNIMIKDRLVRTAITKDNFLLFFHFYFAHYVKYETADFQKEIMHYLQNSATENLYLCAFRGSGKSTIISTAYSLWAILGKQEKKFVVLFGQTKAQAKQHMMNIRHELENNLLLKKDLGPFQEEDDEWGAHSLVFKQLGARITIASAEQSTEAAAAIYISSVAPTLARGMAQNTAAALARRPLAPGAASTSFLFSPGRAVSASITEVTRTGSQADRIAARTIGARLAVRTVGIWQTARDDLVCPICRPLHGRPELGPNGWASRVPGGSPAHIGCRCEIVYRFEPLAGRLAGPRV